MKLNGNYRWINYEAQDGDADSVLHYYRRIITLRAGSELLKYGVFKPLFANRRVMAYLRELDGESMTVLVKLFQASGTRSLPR